MTTPETPLLDVRGVPAAVWIVVASVLFALAIFANALLPRYDIRMIGDDGHAVLIYDRWTGRLQRANYDADGRPTLTGILTPF